MKIQQKGKKTDIELEFDPAEPPNNMGEEEIRTLDNSETPPAGGEER